MEHVLERVVDVAEGGPLGGAPLPAAAHQLVHGARTPRRTLHAVALQRHQHLSPAIFQSPYFRNANKLATDDGLAIKYILYSPERSLVSKHECVSLFT